MIDYFHRLFHLPYSLRISSMRVQNKNGVTLVFVHGIGSSGEMWASLVRHLPSSQNYIVVDLLGFGGSPQPNWETYDSLSQARCVVRTLRGAKIKGKLKIVGHSMGSLIAVEMANLIPKQIDGLLLCSPPVYAPEPLRGKPWSQDMRLRRFYQYLETRPKLIVGAYGLLQQIKYIGDGLRVTEDNVIAFTTALRASIINQNTIERIPSLTMPIAILNGRFDPLTVSSNLKKLASSHHNIVYHDIPTSHAVTKQYETIILTELGVLDSRQESRKKTRK